MAEDQKTPTVEPEVPVTEETAPEPDQGTDTPVIAEVPPEPPEGDDPPVTAAAEGDPGSDQEPAVEVTGSDRRRIVDDPGIFDDDLDDELVEEIETRLTEELSKEGEGRRYRGQKVELDKADLNLDLELDLETEEGPEVDDGPPALTEAAPTPTPEAPVWWTRWPVLAGAGAVAAVLGVALIFMLRGPASEGPDVRARTIWRGQIEDQQSLRLALDPFFVPIKGAPSRQLRIRLVIVLSDLRARAYFRRFSPTLIACRNAVYQILTHKSLEELTLDKVGLQRQIQARLNQIISGGKVTQVHFTEFLVTRAGDPIVNRG